MTINTNPITNMPGEPSAGADLTVTSDAVVLRSSPDLALPLESEPAVSPGRQTESFSMDTVRQAARDNPAGAIAMAAGAGLLFGVILKKSFPARRRS